MIKLRELIWLESNLSERGLLPQESFLNQTTAQVHLMQGKAYQHLADGINNREKDIFPF